MREDLNLRCMSIEYALTKMIIEKELTESIKKGLFTNHFKGETNESKTNIPATTR